MATIESCQYSFEGILRARAFRNARCYAPESVIAVLRDVITAPDLELVIDVDTLERSALARIDRMMLLALDSLSRSGVHIVLFARYERRRADLLQEAIRGASCMGPNAEGRVRLPRTGPILLVSDDPALLAQVGDDDRGIALGRPELVRANIAAVGDTSVRATLWWMLEARTTAR
jgi:hypothetical protein